LSSTATLGCEVFAIVFAKILWVSSLQNHTAKSGCATQPQSYAFAAALRPFTATLNRDL